MEEVKQHKEAARNARDELLQAQEVCREMLAARRSAREALSDMAHQNARLVSAYVEKKQELRHLQDNIREERLQWQVPKKLCLPSSSPMGHAALHVVADMSSKPCTCKHGRLDGALVPGQGGTCLPIACPQALHDDCPVKLHHASTSTS